MNYGHNGKMWITWPEQHKEEARKIFDIVVGKESVAEVQNALLNHGLILVDTEQGMVGGANYTYANDKDLVEVHLFHNIQVSVTIKNHSSGSPRRLMRFWAEFKKVCERTPEEMQN